jgi:hypothetical protein
MGIAAGIVTLEDRETLDHQRRAEEKNGRGSTPLVRRPDEPGGSPPGGPAFKHTEAFSKPGLLAARSGRDTRAVRQAASKRSDTMSALAVAEAVTEARMRKLKIMEHISLDGVIQHSADDGELRRLPLGKASELAGISSEARKEGYDA